MGLNTDPKNPIMRTCIQNRIPRHKQQGITGLCQPFRGKPRRLGTEKVKRQWGSGKTESIKKSCAMTNQRRDRSDPKPLY